MALTQTTRARCFVALLLAAGVTLLGVALKETFSAASYDLLHSLSQISGGRFSDDRVVIIYLDLASFLLAKQNPADRWPRQFHAQLLDRLTADGARAAVFDILFDSPGDNPAADAALADALKKNSRAVLAAEHNDKNSHATSAAAERARIATLRPPEKLFADAAAAWGVAALEVDDSFVVRRHLPAFGGERTASLSLAAARFLGATNMSGGELWVRYYGPAITLPHVSYSEALDPAALPSGFFRDKIVFIGARPTVGFMDAKQDEFRNPFHSWANKEFFMPGVEVHATQLLNWLRGDALKRHSNTGENLLLLLAALIFGGGLPWLRPAAATVAAGIGAVAVLAASLAVFSANVWFPWLAIVAAQIPAALFGSWLWQFQEWFLTRRKLEAAKRITDAKIREQAALLDKAQDAILVQSLEGRILYANPSAERLFGAANVSPSPLKGERAGVRGATVEGHQKASMASNEPAHPSPSITLSSEGKGKSEAARWEISDVFSADPFTADEARAVALRDGEWNGEIRLRTNTRGIVIAASRWTLIRDETNQPSALLLINSDITEQKNLEQQFLRAQRMNTIGALAGGMAHDLNNALAPVLLGAQLLRRKAANEEDKTLLSLIENSANRGADMVRQVLLFARGRGGEFERLELGPVIKDFEKMVRETFPKSIFVETFVARDLWPVRGNLTQLHQVLLNLCVNARDAMSSGGKLSFVADNVEFDEAEMEALRADIGTPSPGPARLNHHQRAERLFGAPNAKFISLLLSDTGTGMTPEVKAKMFEPFFTTKGEEQGTGIGLTTVARIVRAHGGFLRVESEPGQGASFEVFLPCALGFVAEEKAKTVESFPRGHGELILLADDEQALCDLVGAELVEFGYRVLTAVNGAEAVALFKRHAEEIRLLVTDNSMPVMTGPQAIAEIRKANATLPVILIGADAEAKLPGVTELAKPFALAELLEAASRCLK